MDDGNQTEDPDTRISLFPNDNDADLPKPYDQIEDADRDTDLRSRRCRCSQSDEQWNCSVKAFKKKVWKDIIVTSCALALLFTSIAGLTNLQSSLFVDQGLGVMCQSITYVSLAISSLLLPKIVTARLGHKWALVVSLFGQVLWLSANGYATWATMTIASVAQGASGALLWAAFGSYLCLLAGQYARKTEEDQAKTISLFFGVSFGLVKTSRLFGSVLSWGVLQKDMKNSSVISEDDLLYCGASDCPWRNTTNVFYAGPPNYLLWSLVGVCVTLGICSILLTVLFVDNLPSSWSFTDQKRSRHGAKKETIDFLLAASKLHADVKQVLIIPICVYIGMVVSFVQADYSKSYATCALGIWMVGLLMIPNAILTVFAAIVSGKLGKSFLQFIFGTLLDTGLLLACLMWRPNPDNIAVFFIISSLFGITTSIWHAQINVLVGVIFTDKETALANCVLWQSVGFALSFGLSRSICVTVKIYLTLSMLAMGILCLAILQIYIHKRRQRGRHIPQSIELADYNKK